MKLLCISIQAPNTPDPNFLHVCLLSFVLSASPVTLSVGEKQEQEKVLETLVPGCDSPKQQVCPARKIRHQPGTWAYDGADSPSVVVAGLLNRDPHFS
jgi:hypothetical protein